ncbi:MAG: hypothetical protein RMJ28_01115 [Nitrososphaerota archaeon]|nr:hypothetical protein [Candidatus Calditenuaceae archaeon]MDW8072830.1 hypothetical protein [Nitrososphaerota archaeon]
MSRRGVTTKKIVDDIVKLIKSSETTGLATLRHYPMERRIYQRFGTCGFSLEIVRSEGERRKRISVLVEARAKNAGRSGVRGYEKVGGVVRCVIAEEAEGRLKYRVLRGGYRDMSELFKSVEEVRSAFYERYRTLKPGATEREIFHVAGIPEDELHLGV